MSAMGFSANSGAVSSIKEWDLVLISEMKLLVENELCLKHEAFVLGTSETKHDNGAFEIFITTAPIPDLNEKLAVFGKVVKGGDIVQEIEEVDTDEHYRPKSSIAIHRVTLKQSI
ncbi:hypothetical protein V6N13_068739 [Hibiscus sabdariffa]